MVGWDYGVWSVRFSVVGFSWFGDMGWGGLLFHGEFKRIIGLIKCGSDNYA